MKQLLLTAFMLPALLLGCEKKPETPVAATPAPAAAVTSQPTAAAAGAVFASPIEPDLFEQPTDALVRWRQFRDAKPTLVLLSFDPFLQPLAKELRSEAVALASSGSAAELGARARIFRADPALLPTQTLSAALEAGLFSRLCWVFPSTVKPEDLTLELFRKQMTDAKFFSEAEAAGLALADGIYSGTLRGIPFQAIHPWALPQLEGPLLLHIDLSYFRGLYKDSATTPIYQLLHQTATTLRESGWQPEAVSLSFSTEEGAVSLDTRFLLRDLAFLLRQPAILDGDPPEHWNQRAEAFHGVDVFTAEKMLELVEKMVAKAPEDPSVQYDHYTTLLEAKKIDDALAALDRAVAGDPGYAYAYAELAQIAIKDRNAQTALTLLNKAAAAYPENPFIPLQMADVQISTGAAQEALKILQPLKQLTWSKAYHDDIPALLERMSKDAQSTPAKGAN